MIWWDQIPIVQMCESTWPKVAAVARRKFNIANIWPQMSTFLNIVCLEMMGWGDWECNRNKSQRDKIWRIALLTCRCPRNSHRWSISVFTSFHQILRYYLGMCKSLSEFNYSPLLSVFLVHQIIFICHWMLTDRQTDKHMYNQSIICFWPKQIACCYSVTFEITLLIKLFAMIVYVYAIDKWCVFGIIVSQWWITNCSIDQTSDRVSHSGRYGRRAMEKCLLILLVFCCCCPFLQSFWYEINNH